MDELMKAIDQVTQVDFKLDKLEYLVRNLTETLEDYHDEKEPYIAMYFYDHRRDFICALDIMFDYLTAVQKDATELYDKLIAIKREAENDIEPVAVNQ